MIHLHVHTDSSVLDGACQIDRLIKCVKEQGESAVGISDHGNMTKVYEFYTKCKDAGIKPIIGCEFYMGEPDEKDRFHILLIAKDNTGLHNLYKLMHKAHGNFYYKPRISKDMLLMHNKGLICLSACIGNEIFKMYSADSDKVEQKILDYKSMFGDDYYLEIQPNQIKEQKAFNIYLKYICLKYNIKPIVTTDAHYVYKEDSTAHDTMLCIQTKKKKKDIERFRFSSNDFYIKTNEEIHNELDSLLGTEFVTTAIYSTHEVANKCDAEIQKSDTPLTPHMPWISDETKEIKRLVSEGYKRRYNQGKFNGLNIKEVKERIKYELDILIEKDYVGYFLVVDDYLRFCVLKNLFTGPGRGSCCGSEVAFVLGMTEVEPIRYGLIFERFINPTRESFPDFDGDFDYDRRNEVVDYIVERYGAPNVAQIGTEGKMTTKAVIRKVLSAYDYPMATINATCKLADDRASSVQEAISMSDKLKERLEREPDAFKDICVLEGLMSHTGTHAAGLIIAPDKIDNYVPVSIDKETGMQVSQWHKKIVEKIGLIKFDMLGLKQLTQYRLMLDYIRVNHGVSISKDDLYNIDFDDPNIYKVLNSGMLCGIFQFTGFTAGQVIAESKPQCFEDIMVNESICRPGVKEASMYIENKKMYDKEGYFDTPDYWELVQDILEPTYGAIVYQEQTMLIMNRITGGDWSLGKADAMRKVKNLEEYREDFVECAVRNNICSSHIANQIFDRFSLEYSFNKSHACAYGMNSAITLWGKAYYPVEFMATSMTIELTQGEPDILSFIKECKQMGINIIPPTINESTTEFIPTKDGIIMPLTAIARCGKEVVDEIIRCRPYTDLLDFISKVQKKKVNSATVTNLIKAGAFLNFNQNRSTLLEQYFTLIKKKDTVMSYCDEVQMMYEKQVYGFYLGKHPLDGQINSNLNDAKDGETTNIVGIVTEVKEVIDKNNKQMAFITLDNKVCTFGAICFSWCYPRFKGVLKQGNIVKLVGKKDKTSLLINDVEVI